MSEFSSSSGYSGVDLASSSTTKSEIQTFAANLDKKIIASET